MTLKNAAYLSVICVTVVFTLIYGQRIIIPFLLGMLLWFIGTQLIDGLDNIPLIRDYFPHWTKSILAMVVLTMLVFSLTNVIYNNINYLASSLERYQPNIDKLIITIEKKVPLDVRQTYEHYTGNLDYANVLRALFASLTGIISITFMILIYAVFIFLEEANFRPKLKKIFTNKLHANRIDKLLNQIEQSIADYFRLKTLISLITGLCSYVALKLIGVEAPEFWAFLIFLLNFIPTIGSLVATIFPAIFCLFQFGTFLPAILVLLIVGTIQLLVGNFLEPRIMGSSMNISPLVTILSLSIWGAIWGIIGMILSVPITVVAIIIFSQFEKTRPVAIMLSEKGNVD